METRSNGGQPSVLVFFDILPTSPGRRKVSIARVGSEHWKLSLMHVWRLLRVCYTHYTSSLWRFQKRTGRQELKEKDLKVNKGLCLNFEGLSHNFRPLSIFHPPVPIDLLFTLLAREFPSPWKVQLFSSQLTKSTFLRQEVAAQKWKQSSQIIRKWCENTTTTPIFF